MATYGNRLHIWKRREIENYVLSLNAILSALKSKSNANNILALKPTDVMKALQEIAQLLINKIVIMSLYSKYKKVYLTEEIKKQLENSLSSMGLSLKLKSLYLSFAK